MKKYAIYDWAGNNKTDYYGTFDSFEDAWDALYTEFSDLDDDAFEEQMGEFFVEAIK